MINFAYADATDEQREQVDAWVAAEEIEFSDIVEIRTIARPSQAVVVVWRDETYSEQLAIGVVDTDPPFVDWPEPE